MIEKLNLKNVNLKAFLETPPAGDPSEVWNCDLTFQKGRSYLIEATSGRGKSSLCAFLYGLRKDYVGEISFVGDDGKVFNGDSCDYVKIRQYSMSMMFQEHRLFPELSAVDNVMLKSQLTGFVTDEKVREMLCRLGLHDRLDTLCGRMSFGQQQRVAFVRALCQPCDFIFLDEPISHLDEGNAQIMSDMLLERQKKDGVGVIVTSIGYRLPYKYDEILKL